MKKTVEQLKQIIKEELARILAEEAPFATDDPGGAGGPSDFDRAPADASVMSALEEDEELYYDDL